jgi:hypothetical protein
MTAVLVRITLRYAAGALAAHGLLSHDMAHAVASDPDIATAVELGAAGALGLASEGWYFLAHKFGWTK